MKKEYSQSFRCPECKGGLSLVVREERNGSIKEGEFHCARCKKEYKLTKSIPRFVDRLEAIEAHTA